MQTTSSSHTPSGSSATAEVLRDRWDALLWAVIAVALVSRQLEGSFDVDEVTYVLAGGDYLSGRFRTNPEHPPLGKYLIGISVFLFGATEFSARLPSLVSTGVLVYVAARMGRLLTGSRWAGSGAALLVLSSEIILRAGSIARLDGMLSAAILVHIYLVMRWWMMAESHREERVSWWRENQTTRERRLLAWIGISAGVAFAVKYTAAFFFIPLLAAAFLFREEGSLRDRIRVITARGTGFRLLFLSGGLTVILLFLPVLLQPTVPLWFGVTGQYHHIQRGHPRMIAGHLFQSAPWWSYLWWIWNDFGWILVVAALAAIYLAYRNGVDRTDQIIGIGLLTPLLILSGLNVKASIYWSPGVALLGVWTASLTYRALIDLGRRRNQWAEIVVPTLLGLLLVLPNGAFYEDRWSDFGTDSEYDEVAEYLDEAFPGGSGLADIEKPIEFYSNTGLDILDYRSDHSRSWIEQNELEFALVPSGGETQDLPALEELKDWTVAARISGYQVCVPGPRVPGPRCHPLA